jgi:hypothetical protein
MRGSVVLCVALVAAMAACKSADKTASDKAGADKAAADKAAADKAAADKAAADNAAPPAADPLVERGHYLADLMGCGNCHTAFGPQGPAVDKAFAGGMEVPEKFGTWRSPNITQDKDTGIGGWTDEQIIKAVREGVRPDGVHLFPIMPYPMYNALSDDDAKALVAFLRTIAPIANKVERATDLKLPEMQVPPAKGTAPDQSNPVAYGGYLATIMHCAMCHSPSDEHGAPDMSKAFAGGFAFEIPFLGKGTLYSANLTSDKETGIGDYTDEQLLAAVKGMTKRDGKLIQGPMAMYQSGWFRLEDADGKALVAFLRSLPAVKNKVPESTFVANPPPGAGAPPAPPASK